MNKTKELMQVLGLARRANQLILGSGPTLKAIQGQTARLVFFPKDGGASQHKKFSDKSQFYQIPFVDDLTRDEISQSIGLNRSIVAISDAGFAKKIKQLLEEKERN
ncbi:ribosomal L7Ae/L30e/S12e/Gadd45 family protein [Fructobacillus sp. M1-13]|uniref:50S ribosomal protein L7ae n=1 Tax=Fructobacillus papyriferae TaxID=2713171 RepID=A0ABS5QP83_9LACO|nr:ribosomal L7Ae/L30e/S12e/Gadd45 family protein [Fructobacillus papyriferae]MBS9334607.1 50S ribosomal protein L7ae [Fructobacillus papyriferae]MCD2158597.1 ribosomal L7Ae/L30e/S12e/Gadd45 family protein [Fructobacillus papyriferae]